MYPLINDVVAIAQGRIQVVGMYGTSSQGDMQSL